MMRRASLVVAACMGLGACVSPAREEERLARHFAEVAEATKAAGGLRTDRSAPDAPFSNADLVRNFERIALYTEFDETIDDSVPRRTATPLLRWETPIRIDLVGRGVRPTDFTNLSTLVDRLRIVTNLSLEVSGEQDKNVQIAFYGAEERRAIAAAMAGTAPQEDINFLVDWAKNDGSPCVFLAYAGDESKPHEISGGLIVIKNELEGVMRNACFHEELAQLMGLLNDDPDVRPSMFNDDEEFALLTEHDEYLLRILYDKRLKPGMTAEEVRVLLPGIVDDLRPGF